MKTKDYVLVLFQARFNGKVFRKNIQYQQSLAIISLSAFDRGRTVAADCIIIARLFLFEVYGRGKIP